MTLTQDTRDEVLLLAASTAAHVLAIMATGKPPSSLQSTIQAAMDVLPKAMAEHRAGGSTMKARRTSKFIDDASFPRVVCLCGSMRFLENFRRVYNEESLLGRVVLSVVEGDGRDRAQLDELHLRKIDLADEVLVVNVDGYAGADTVREVAYARAKGKRVRFTDEAAGLAWLEGQREELDAMAGRFG